MSERQINCSRVSHVEISGEVVKSEMLITISGTAYFISVGTPDYIASLKQFNSGLSADLQQDVNLYPYNGRQTEGEICAHLTQLPEETIAPFLTPIN